MLKELEQFSDVFGGSNMMEVCGNEGNSVGGIENADLQVILSSSNLKTFSHLICNTSKFTNMLIMKMEGFEIDPDYLMNITPLHYLTWIQNYSGLSNSEESD